MFTKVGKFLGRYSFTRKLTGLLYNYEHPMLNTAVCGIKFKNPLGLAAGFDKNCQLMDIMPYCGFGYEEVGSITGEVCKGNPRPRLHRIPKDKAIIVNYGLCNKGSEYFSECLKRRKFKFPIGVSVAKTNDPNIDTEGAVKDYVKAFKLMHPIGVYTTINVSCPNTNDGQTFGHPDNLKKLLKEIAKQKITKPIFLKIKPDMSLDSIDEMLEIVKKHKFVNGFVVSNLTKKRERLRTGNNKLNSMKGAISGRPVKKKSTEIISYIYTKTKGKYVIIGCGGIFTAADAYEKIRAGSSLLQMITGMIYEGPTCMKNINKSLVKLMKQDGFKNISEAVGADAHLN